MKPKEKIIQFIEQDIMPEISDLGFRFIKSKMELERKVGEFRQCIWFRTNARNFQDIIVQFSVYLRVEHVAFAEYRKPFDYSPCFSVFTGCTETTFITESAEYLDEWTKEHMGYRYSIAGNDYAKVARAISRNIRSTTASYLDKNADFHASLEYRYQKFIQQDYFAPLWIPDILILSKYLNRQDIAKETILRYTLWKQSEEGIKDLAEGSEIFDIIERVIRHS